MTTGWGSPIGQPTIDVFLKPITPSVFIAITPETLALPVNAHQQFSAKVTGTSNPGVTWSASAGAITPGGLFTAPAKPCTCQVVATSAAEPGQTDTATVKVYVKKKKP